MQSRLCMRASRPQLGSFLAFVFATLLSPGLQAGPVVLEQLAKLTSPDASYAFGGRVAVDGDTILVVGSRPSPNPDLPFDIEHAVFLFQRTSAGNWVFVRKLAQISQDSTTTAFETDVAVRGGVAAFIAGQLFVFERTASGWTSVAASLHSNSTDVEVHSGMILVSDGGCGYNADLVQKQPGGAWARTQTFVGMQRDGCDDEFVGGDIELGSNRLALGAPGEVHIWDRNLNGSWPVTATAIVPRQSAPDSLFGVNVALDGNDALASVSARPASGPYVLRTDGSWSTADILLRPDRIMIGDSRFMKLQNGFAALGYAGDPHRGDSTGSIAVFQRGADGQYSFAAKLLASDAAVGTALGLDVDMSGRTVVAGSNGAAYVFQLPPDLTQPAVVQDDFEDRNASEWTALAGSSFSVVSSGGTFAYRQASTAADAAAVRTGIDWTNQAIEADAIPRSVASGGERWLGLTVRQTDPNNYHYLTLRNTNVVQLRKLENGAIRVLASATVPFALNRRYRLRLEAAGTWIRGYVDGQLRVQARDTRHTHGAAGLRMFRTSADFDNVVISPNPQVTLLSENFDQGGLPKFFPHLGAWGEAVDGTAVLAQTSLAGDARATTRVEAGDQVVQARAKATSFASGAERWFGLLARFQDDNNFYYLTVRNTNTVSLRKLVNGSIVVLDTATLPVAIGRWYTLRLEAVGNKLRAYVDGRFLMEAVDGSHSSGTYGFATFKTSAHFDDVVVAEP